MIGKTCPRCAERVKAAALVCRHCGHEFASEPAGIDLSKDDDPDQEPVDQEAVDPDMRRMRAILYSALALALIIIIGVVAYALSPRVEMNEQPKALVHSVTTTLPAATEATATDAPPLALGSTLEWDPSKAPPETVRRAGPLTVRITRKTDDDGVAPVVSVEGNGERVTMIGESVADSYTHSVSAFSNTPGAPPAIMLQSFSGGAHCCNTIKLVDTVAGHLKVIDLGSWDGEAMAVPTDLSGDGVPDFGMRDQSFLYAFTAYAMSYAPTRFINIVDGRQVDVSNKPAFRRVLMHEMADAGEKCRTDTDGAVRNGACAAYVAVAGRVGGLDKAWSDMLRSYAPDEQWDYPTGCSVATTGECPEENRIVYKTYPEALLSFLKRAGYVARGWAPTVAQTAPDLETVPETP